MRDIQWDRIEDLNLGGRKGKRGPRMNNRLFVDALRCMARPRARWRDLPQQAQFIETVVRAHEDIDAFGARATMEKWA